MIKRILFGFILSIGTFVSSNGSIIDIQTLLKGRDQYKIIDFRSDYERELNGYIAGSILIPSNESEEGLKLIKE